MVNASDDDTPMLDAAAVEPVNPLFALQQSLTASGRTLQLKAVRDNAICFEERPPRKERSTDDGLFRKAAAAVRHRSSRHSLAENDDGHGPPTRSASAASSARETQAYLATNGDLSSGGANGVLPTVNGNSVHDVVRIGLDDDAGAAQNHALRSSTDASSDSDTPMARLIAPSAFTPVLEHPMLSSSPISGTPISANGFLAPPSPTRRTPAPSNTMPMRRSNTVGNPVVGPSASTSQAASRQSPAKRTRSPRRTLSHGPHLVSRDEHLLSPTAEDAEQSTEARFQDSVAKQAEAIRRERAEKRLEKERTELERATALKESGALEDRALKGNIIGEDHVSYVLMYNMLTGIRIGVSRCQAKMTRDLTDADYKARHKYSFDIVGNELTPSAKYDFKFKDYAPFVFRDLREQFHVDPADYLVSLTARYILSELGSPGKSGSFFYFSRDYKFIIKTLAHSEHRFLRCILRDYHAHVVKNPHTLLSRFYGLHRVKLPRGRKIHFLVMANLFPPHRDIHETYDLKGSSQGRVYPEEKAKDNPQAVLKDLNWVRRGRVLELGPEKKAFFEEQLRRDVELLQKLRIMDYSLLVGVHDLARGNRDNLRQQALTTFQPETGKLRRRPTQIRREAEASALRQAVQRSDPQALSATNRLPDKDRSERWHFIFYQDEGGMRATGASNEPLDRIYYLGIIDILTPYTLYKRVEHFGKSFKYDGDTISAVPPGAYGSRFLRFIFSCIRGGDLSQRPKME